MNQPAPVTAARAAARAAVCRVGPVVLFVLLALLAMPLGSGSASVAAAETRMPASAPVEPVGESQPEETDTELTASGRAGRAAHRTRVRTRVGGPVGHCARPRPCHRAARPSPYRHRTGRPVQLPLPLRTVRCVVLRC